MFNNLKSKIAENPSLIICLLGLVLLVGFSKYSANKKESNAEKIISPPETTDTYIPKGFVLVPIQIINKQQLSDLVGSFALVDLYNNHNSSWQLFASKIKLLRAPLNSQEFAVLAQEEESSDYVKETGFWVTIHNSKSEQMAPIKVKLAKADLPLISPTKPSSKPTRLNQISIEFGQKSTNKDSFHSEFADRL